MTWRLGFVMSLPNDSSISQIYFEVTTNAARTAAANAHHSARRTHSRMIEVHANVAHHHPTKSEYELDSVAGLHATALADRARTPAHVETDGERDWDSRSAASRAASKVKAARTVLTEIAERLNAL